MCDSTNISIFRSSLILVIEFKWEQVRAMVYCLYSFYISFALLFLVEIVWFHDDIAVNWAILLFDVFLLVLELR